MSAEQRLHLEHSIETLAKKDPAFQGALKADGQCRESLFVKDMENVQADECDVIFISMTYGPKEPGGKVLKRFGPINLDSRWRRLNVLFTRSQTTSSLVPSHGKVYRPCGIFRLIARQVCYTAAHDSANGYRTATSKWRS